LRRQGPGAARIGLRQFPEEARIRFHASHEGGNVHAFVGTMDAVIWEHESHHDGFWPQLFLDLSHGRNAESHPLKDGGVMECGLQSPHSRPNR
jgi:hypothetical protein